MIQRLDKLLKLLHLSDSALPIGSAAHSFGLETLVADGLVTPANLPDYCRDYLQEAGRVEAVYLRRSFRIGARLADSAQDAERALAEWTALNRRLSARKPSRESRDAGITLGRRLLQLALTLEADPRLQAAHAGPGIEEAHHANAFGLIAGLWALGEDEAVAAYLQQTMTALISAGQRLMPLGQSRAQSIVWALQPVVLALAADSAAAGPLPEPPAFTPVLDAAGMRHPTLPVRLFIS